LTSHPDGRSHRLSTSSSPLTLASSRCPALGPVHIHRIRDTYSLETKMANRTDHEDELDGADLNRTFQFEKFMRDIERREELRREAAQQAARENTGVNRLRDERNREHLHSRLRWSR